MLRQRAEKKPRNTAWLEIDAVWLKRYCTFSVFIALPSVSTDS
jgi:hypothetical protein